MLRAILVVAALVLAVGPAAAADGVQATTLDNGLRVLLLEDHRSPIVSFQVWYRVGSRNELPGATGLAHFLEHMMFKGTPTHGPGEFARLVEQNGGQDNAFTTRDVTGYFVDIVADKVELILDLEADRMRNLLLDPKAIEAERQVVIEERRTRTEDDPGGFLSEEIGALAYYAHPYGHPIVGWMDDIKRLAPADLRAFYTTYYQPNNATVVAVGDFQAAALLAKIRQRFGAIPRAPDPPPVTAVEPPQSGERRVTVRKQAKLPVVYLAWHVPNHESTDAAALELLSTILSAGRTARLYRHLVYERRLALDAGGDYSYLSRDPYLFWFWATPLPGQTPEALEQALLGEIARVGQAPVTEEELQRAKNQIESSFVFAQDSIHRRASQLIRYDLAGGYRLQEDFLVRIRAVTAADVQRVARAWFLPDRKNVGVLVPLP